MEDRKAKREWQNTREEDPEWPLHPVKEQRSQSCC